KRQFYWDIGKNGLYAFVALAMLMIFLKLLKKTNSSDLPLGLPVGHVEGAGSGAEASPVGAPDSWRQEAKPGVVTVEVLNALIKENPPTMPQAVRSWLPGNNGST